MSITWNQVTSLAQLINLPYEANGEFALVCSRSGAPVCIKYIESADFMEVKFLHELSHALLLNWGICPSYKIKDTLHRQILNGMSADDLKPAQQEYFYRQLMTMELWAWVLTFDIIKYVLDDEVTEEMRQLALQCLDTYAEMGGLSPHWMNPIYDWDKTDYYWMTW